MLHSAIVRAHQHAAGARRQKGGRLPRALAAHGGGLSTKIHAASDALGNPARLIGSPGHRDDIAFAHDLIDGFVADAMIADKSYDADRLCEKIAENRRPTRDPAQAKQNVQTRPRRDLPPVCHPAITRVLG